MKTCTKWDRLVGRKPVRDRAPDRWHGGCLCWWHTTGKEPTCHKRFFLKGCPACEEKAARDPSLRGEKSPDQLWAEMKRRQFRADPVEAAQIRAGAPARVAAYLAKLAAQPAPGRV